MKKCVFCDKEVVEPFVEMSGIPNEGRSSLRYGKGYYDLDGMCFCDLRCFFNDIRYKLG